MSISTGISTAPDANVRLRRFILTGPPGAGKTAILRQLELDGFSVIEEAATDIIAWKQAQGIAEPWLDPGFVDSILDLQRRRENRTALAADHVQFCDRSPICTFALARFLGHPISKALSAEIERIEREATYQKRVFFIENLGFVTHTAARKISFDDALRFGQLHEEAYRSFGYDLIPIAPGRLSERVNAIKAAVATR